MHVPFSLSQNYLFYFLFSLCELFCSVIFCLNSVYNRVGILCAQQLLLHVLTNLFLNFCAHFLHGLKICMFVCAEVLQPSQPNGVMSSAVSLPNHTFTGQA